jgi:hypothetical protein
MFCFDSCGTQNSLQSNEFWEEDMRISVLKIVSTLWTNGGLLRLVAWYPLGMREYRQGLIFHEAGDR